MHPNIEPAKTVIDASSLEVGRDVRRRPGGRGCTVKRLSDDRVRVLVEDSGRCFWIRMDTLVRDWF